MSLIAEKTLCTAEDLWRMGGEGAAFELIAGELVETSPKNHDHSLLTYSVAHHLRSYANEHDLGDVIPHDPWLHPRA